MSTVVYVVVVKARGYMLTCCYHKCMIFYVLHLYVAVVFVVNALVSMATCG